MKKLIALAAIATCGSLLAVESANIVGYSNSTYTGKKWNCVGATFIGVTNTDGQFRLGDIVATGWDYESDELRTLKTSNGGTDVSMFYLTAAVAEEIGAPSAGWYDGDGNCHNDDVFDIGSGFLTCLYSDVTFTYSGQVYPDEIPLSYAGKKWNVVANPLPTAITLGQVTATGWDYESDELRTLKTSNGGTSVSMFYLTAAVAEEIGAPSAGWYDGDGECHNDDVVNPGEGFLTCLYSNVTLTFPAAIPSNN